MNEEKIRQANIITGEGNYKDFVFKILEEKLNFKISSNPDFLLLENESFGINDARSLEKWALNKPFLSETKVSFVVTKSISYEAQNALLRILEEPPSGTYFFIGLESLGGLLPTFISRVAVLNAPSTFSGVRESESIGFKFLRAGIGERFSLIHSLLKNENRANIKEFIRDLEKISYENHVSNMLLNVSKTKTIKNILVAKTFVAARGSSTKMLLEWLSCVL